MIDRLRTVPAAHLAPIAWLPVSQTSRAFHRDKPGGEELFAAEEW